MRKNHIKIIAVILTCVMMMTSGQSLVCFGAFNKTTANTVAANATISGLTAKAFAAIYFDSGEVVFSSDSGYEHYSVGNMIKLMTLYLAFEAVYAGKTDYNSGIKVSKAAQNISVGRERVYLDAGKGEVITVDQAITAICVGSANDAAYALAEHISGTDETAFVAMMNAKAEELGMSNTHFMDSTGIKTIDEGQYSCAVDMCVLSYNLVKNFPDVLAYTTMTSGSFHHTSTGQPDTDMVSSNALVSSSMLEGADGLLVGYSKADLYAQAATAMIDNERAVAVVIGEETPERRAGELKYLLQHTVQSFERKRLAEEGTYVRMISVKDGKVLKVKTCTGSDLYYIANLTQDYTVESKIVIDGEICAPVSIGDVAGYILYEKVFAPDENGNSEREEIGRIDLIINEDVDRAGWFTRLLRKILQFLGLMDYS